MARRKEPWEDLGEKPPKQTEQEVQWPWEESHFVCSRNSKEASVARAEGIQEKKPKRQQGPHQRGSHRPRWLDFCLEGDGSS